jgi:hypothetical protein
MIYRSVLLLTAALLSIFLIHEGIRSPPKKIRYSSRYQSPPKHLKHMTFGFNEMTADMLWLRFIQDIDHCNSLDWASEIVEARCKKGWGYEMVLSIHEVAPKFRIPMAVGPLSLSVLQDDIVGASELFIKATEAFPNDWPILYRAAFHFMEEEKDPKKAAEYLNRASNAGGPVWLKSLAAKMYDKEGQAMLALQTLLEYKTQIENPIALKKVEERIQALRSSLNQ